MKILDTQKISHLSIKVSEKISHKNVLKFLRTSILNSTLSFNKTSHFYYTYIDFSSTYEIMVYDKVDQNTLLEPFLLKNMAPQNTQNIVYVTDTYFVVYIQEELQLLKFISDTTVEDIAIYIEQLYGYKSFSFIFLSAEELELLKQKEYPLSHSIDIPLYENKSFQFFLAFFLVVSLLFVSFFGLQIIDIQKSQLPIKIREEKSTRVLLNKPLEKAIELFSYIQSHPLYIKKVFFINNTISTVLYDTQKENLLQITKKYKNQIKIKSMTYNNEKKLYSMDVIIVY